jgi:hypothetical protein
MSAVTLQPIIVAQYEEARRHLKAFHEAADKRDTRGAASALQNAAIAICRGLSAAVNDQRFWAEAAELINPANTAPEALQAVLAGLEVASEEEGKVLMNGGYSSESIGILLGNFDLTLGAFKNHPAGDTLELAIDRVNRARQVICELSSRPVIIERQGFWGRGYRTVVNCFKVLGGVGTIVSDVAGVVAAAAAAPPLTHLAVGIAVASVMSGISAVSGVGETIFGGVYRQ